MPVRLPDAVRPLCEFFELHASGADLPADLCAGFRDALSDVLSGALRYEGMIERLLRAAECPAGEDAYDHAARHQRNRDLVKTQCVPIDEKVIAFPNIIRAEAMDRLRTLQGEA
jgi:hypothetical protein